MYTCTESNKILFELPFLFKFKYRKITTKLLNRFMIPAILLAVVMVAGVFAFMPVEKASTVHSTLASSTTQTNNEALVDSELDGQDRVINFYYNMSHFEGTDGSCGAGYY